MTTSKLVSSIIHPHFQIQHQHPSLQLRKLTTWESKIEYRSRFSLFVWGREKKKKPLDVFSPTCGTSDEKWDVFQHPKYPDPSRVLILRTRTPAIQVQTPPLEGPRFLMAHFLFLGWLTFHLSLFTTLKDAMRNCGMRNLPRAYLSVKLYRGIYMDMLGMPRAK